MRTIGPYRLLNLIGEGGMGEVYLAEREGEFRKRVAIKLIRAGMASQEVVRRFVMERHLLAALNHPHIVRLVDGGATEEGLPYLVVDYVEGTSIDRYCDERKLSINDRLRLFIDVCMAVHYAHQSLIIHCDLKPGNILVTSEGAAMLLDFGIAKLVNPVALGLDAQTVTRLRAYTPRYASPEQLRGEPVTTACDIYALGVILYELLSGHSPYRVTTTGSLVEWVRSVCEEDADAPSVAIERVLTVAATETEPAAELTPENVSRQREANPQALRRRLQGDLDAIALKALRKEPKDRYGSVDQMADDLRRHLAGLPVQARKNTTGYVARKFLQRHKFGAIAAALLLLTVGAGLASTLWEARVAARRFDDVRSLAHTFLFDVHDAIQNLPGSTPARSLIANTGAAYLDRLAKDSHGNAALGLELAQGYLKIGDVEGNPFASNLGNTAKAEENYRKALVLAEAETARDAKNQEAREVLAKTHLGLAEVLPFRNQSKEGLTHAGKALELYRAISAARPQNAEDRLGVSRAWETQGDVQGGLQGINLGQSDAALKSYQESLAAIPELPAQSELAVRAGRARAVVMTKIGDMTARKGENQVAISTYQTALGVAEDLLRKEPTNTRTQGVVTALLNRLASSETALGQVDKALGHFQKSIAINDAALALDPNNEKAMGNVAVDQKNMGDLYLYVVQNGAEALKCYQKAAEMLEVECRRDPRNMVWSQRLAEVLTDIATCLIATGKPQEALKSAQRGLAIAKELADRPGATMDQVYNYAWLAVSVDPDSLKNPAAALPYAQKAVEMSHAQNPMCLHVLGQAYAGMGNYKDAAASDEKALALYPATPSHNRGVAERALARYREKLKGH